MRLRFAGLLSILIFSPYWIGAATPQHQNETLDKVSFTQNLGAQVPLQTRFTNEFGATVPLSTYFGQKPVLLTLVYFKCPMLCTEVLNGAVRTMRMMTSLSIGKDFNVVTISFDPRETSELAAKKKAVYIDRYKRAGAATGWPFLTGSETSIKAVADAVGFHYVYDKEIDQYAHASGIMILTPEGKVSHYFFGVEYPPGDVRLSLIEASHNAVGSRVDQLLLYCYHYDPATGHYGIAIMKVLRLAGIATALLLATMIFTTVLRDRAAARNA